MAQRPLTLLQKPEPPPRFLSLKWKALFSLSLILAVINAAFYILNARQLESGLEKSREAFFKLNQKTVTAILESSAAKMQETAELLPSVLQIRSKQDITTSAALQSKFSHAAATLQFELNIDYLGIFNDSARLQFAWGDNLENELGDSRLQAVIAEVLNKEHPQTLVKCASACMQISVIPMRAGKNTFGTLVVGQYITNLILEFKRLSSADIGIILLSDFDTSLRFPSDRYLPYWNATVFAVSNQSDSLPIIRDIERRASLNSLLDQHKVFKVGETTLEFSIFPLRYPNLQGDGFAIIIDDVSALQQQLISARQVSLLTGILGLLASEAVMLLVLWNPLSRLTKIANTLPLLAQSKFAQFRIALEDNQHHGIGNDEIDHLDATAMRLTAQLEGLHNQVNTHTEMLAENMAHLKQEMTFAHRLLDTAQVIIVTQNRTGQILLMNKFGLDLLGYTEKDVLGKQLAELFDHKDVYTRFTESLISVALGAQQRFRNDARLQSKNGKARDITWLHSHLENDSDSGPALLSVGLDITETKVAEEHITWLADHDSLTGLYNRRRFQELTETMLKLAARYRHSGTIMFLDLDNFKIINDTQGHHAGDMVIKYVANTLTRILRDTDIVARLGGDEFAIALPEIDRSGAEIVANGINKALTELNFPGSSNLNRLSTSIGISLFPQHGDNFAELLSNADLAMYRAKQRGRACWHVFSFDEQDRVQIEQQVFWRQRIEQALTNNRFVLHFQPIMTLQDDRISHYEVLVRMQDYNGKLIAPAPFIKVAERTGLISDIDHWVIRAALTYVRKLGFRGQGLHFSLNLSAFAFSDQRLLPLLTELSRDNNLITENIILEITETAALQDFSTACEMIARIKKMGYSFALDDFGVGFSSFYYLQQLPVDYIKIDGSFVQGLAQNPNNQTLIKAITDVAKGFGIKTIAEYVEDEDTLRLLRTYNVDFAQGYFIGRPDELLLYQTNRYESPREQTRTEKLISTEIA